MFQVTSDQHIAGRRGAGGPQGSEHAKGFLRLAEALAGLHVFETEHAAAQNMIVMARLHVPYRGRGVLPHGGAVNETKYSHALEQLGEEGDEGRVLGGPIRRRPSHMTDKERDAGL